MNQLDKVISWFSPQAGLRRARARAAEQALLSYEGVRSDRRTGGWTTSGSSGNAEIGPSLKKLRDNARDLERNNPYARRAAREWSKRVVGTGITPRITDPRVRELWNAWSRQCMSDRRMPFPAAQKLLAKSAFISGECLVRMYDRRLTDGLAVPFQIDLLEPDFIDTSKTQKTQTGYIIQGVEFNNLGVIQGYHLFGDHPGAVLQTSARGLLSKFVPASDILHHCEIDRPGDVHSVSRLAAVMNKLRDIDEYADAEIVRKKIAACMVGMVTQPEGLDGPTAGPTVTDSKGKKIESFEPGMMMYGSIGSDAKFFSPPDSGDFGAHKKVELREVAVGLDIPYVLLDDNLEAVNYSSFRGGLLAYRDAVDEYRWNWFIPQICDPIWARFAKTLAMLGIEADPVVEWDPPPFDLLDRAAEAEADRIELQIGKKTWPQLIGGQGNDPEKHINEISAWRPRLEKAGVTFARSTSESSTGDGNGNNQPTPAAD